MSQVITPVFNPNNAAEQDIFVSGRAPYNSVGWDVHVNHPGVSDMPVDIYRVDDLDRIASGVGLVSSRVLETGSVGNVEEFDMYQHVVSHRSQRVGTMTTPFVSFSGNPQNLANRFILANGFGIRGGKEAAVVKAVVAPDRLVTLGLGFKTEFLLLGGLAAKEFVGLQTVADFVAEQVEPDKQILVAKSGLQVMSRDDAFDYWRTQS